jgi:hypothetical protein
MWKELLPIQILSGANFRISWKIWPKLSSCVLKDVSKILTKIMDFKLLKKPALLRRHQVKNNKIGTS